MPLRDHFHPPIQTRRHWEAIHATWIGAMVRQLNDRLPPGYVAEPQVHLGALVALDVASFEDLQSPPTTPGGNGVATAVWAPPRPTTTFAIDFVGRDVHEVRVFDETRALRLVAAVELVSPRNKDRPDSRRDFAVKVASYLQERISVILIDGVTNRRANMYEECLSHLGLTDSALGDEPEPLCAAALRTSKPGDNWHLDVWYEALTLGRGLPTLPLWLAADLAIPLDLEASYEETFQTLRIV